jgi:hypothetical protein
MNRTSRWPFFAALLAVIVIVSAGLAAPDLQIFANGKPVAGAAPTLIEGATYLPLRATAEALGAKLEWIEKTKTAVLCSGELCYPVRVTDPESGARVVDGRILLPLRKLAEALGCDVTWDAARQRVEITRK